LKLSVAEITRDVGLTKEMWESTQKITILKQLQTHFKAKHEKGVGTPSNRFPPHYTAVKNSICIFVFVWQSLTFAYNFIVNYISVRRNIWS